MSYAELWCRSSGSLLQGASQPEELVEAAVEAGLSHLAITDRDGVYALVSAHQAAEAAGLPLICGATITVADAPPVVLLAETHEGWSRLSRLITDGQHREDKGRSRVSVQRLCEAAGGLTLLMPPAWSVAEARPVAEAFAGHLEVVLSRTLSPTDRTRTRAARSLAEALGASIVASNDVLYHAPRRRPLADVLTAIRRRTTLQAAGRALAAQAERHLLSPTAFAARFHDLPEAVERTVAVAERCRFRLSELRYTYPRETVPEGHTAMGWLRELADRGARERYPGGVPDRVRAQIRHELGVIEQLGFASYFLTVHDIVRFARSQGILCQGRGSAANSAVCYCLGITAVDPARSSLLFERFISPERGEPPDIDVDFEHERREEVMQYVYRRYGRERAAMVNEIIAYRPRSAVRDVGKAFGLSLDQVDRLAGLYGRWSAVPPGELHERVAEAGLDPTAPAIRHTLSMAGELVGFPRHVGIHSGGFVIADGAVVDLVPVEPASMADRTVVQWDKYGVEGLGFVKVDLLALGMLTAIRRAFDLIETAYGTRWALHTIPAEDPAVYEMFSRADTVGVFQIESRAQQSMLPRLKPATFYDLVIEVAIVRPGPIQGGMVHPYLRRREGLDPVTYAHPDLEPILERTLGVPLFQEQVMEMAVTIGGFTPGEADALRRAMGAWRKKGGLDTLGRELVRRMIARGIPEPYAERIFEQLLGFGEYGFPESHAASFALLVYVSGWIKCHHPAAFCAALINSQPMGFYAPRSLVGDAQRHGVEVRPVCVQTSDWDCTLEPRDGPEAQDPGQPTGPDRSLAALRLGLRLVRGLSEDAGRRVQTARSEGGAFASLPDMAARTGLDRRTLELLADAGAFDALVPDRRQAAWILQGLWTDLPLFAGLGRHEPPTALPEASRAEALQADYRSTGLSLDKHPAAEARSHLAEQGVVIEPLAHLDTLPHDAPVRICGLISSRQRPGTAKGVTFLSLEDETGMANVVVWRRVWEAHRRTLAQATVLVVDGRLQRQGQAMSVLAEQPWRPRDVPEVRAPSRDFR